VLWYGEVGTLAEALNEEEAEKYSYSEVKKTVNN